MATRGKSINEHKQQTKDRIKATALLARLHSHVMDECEMSNTQVRAALGLLNKVLPDVKAIEVSGDAENPLTIEIVRFAKD